VKKIEKTIGEFDLLLVVKKKNADRFSDEWVVSWVRAERIPGLGPLIEKLMESISGMCMDF
jgi:hypothetical protein